MLFISMSILSQSLKMQSNHDPNGITLLCPNHHQNKTSGRLSVDTVKKFNSKPKSLEKGFVNDFFDIFKCWISHY